MRALSIQETQELIKRELDIVWDFCERNGLRPYLIGGTALGAVRDGGFIAWDDDGDIGLMRDDYEKLIHLFRDTERYELLEMSRTPGYNYPFAKLSDKRTRFVEPHDTGLSQLGVYLDIFCLDPMAHSGIRRRLAAAFARAYRLAFYARRNDEDLARGCLPKRMARRMILAGSSALGQERVLRCVKELCLEEGSELLGNVWGAHEARETVPRSWFGEGAPAVFEGTTYRVPEKWDQYFTSLYGPDWQTPRHDTGATHGRAYLLDETV